MLQGYSLLLVLQNFFGKRRVILKTQLVICISIYSTV
jgi:hypothetical protein